MKISIIGQIANKKTGLGKAINDFIDYTKNSSEVESVEQIDITNNKFIFSHIKRIIFSSSDFFYFTPAGSFGGNIRDSLLLLAMIFKRKKIIVHFHNSNFGNIILNSKLLYFINKKIYSYIDKIIILGKKQKEMFHVLNISDEKFSIIRNGVNEEMFITEDELNKKWEKPIKNVVFFSNLIPEKGYEIVLDVAKEFQKNSSYKFFFSGVFFDDGLKAKFLEEIQLLNNITYIPGVYDNHKREFLHKAHIFILPSVYKDETLPISMLEAMASGAYIISSDVGVIPEVVSGNPSYLLDMSSKDIVTDIVNVIINLNTSTLKFNLLKLREKYLLKNIQKKVLNTILNLK